MSIVSLSTSINILLGSDDAHHTPKRAMQSWIANGLRNGARSAWTQADANTPVRVAVQSTTTGL
jgi:hypothetical protein